MSVLTLGRVMDWVDGRLAEADAAQVATQLAAYPDLATAVHEYRSVRHSAATDDSFAPPDAALRRAFSIMGGRLPALNNWLDAVADHLMRLVFDSRHGAAALRAVDEQMRTALRFERDAMTLDLECTLACTEPAAWRIVGRLDGQGTHAGTVSARRPDGSVVISAAISGDGAFVLEIPNERVSLDLEFENGGRFVVGDLEIAG